MKHNAILRIILWSLVIVLLLGILTAVLGYRSLHRNREASRTEATMIPQSIATEDTETPVDHSTEKVPLDTVQYDASDIRNLEIQWASGDITIRKEEGINTIQISQENTSNHKYETVIRRSGDTLTIQFSQEDVLEFGFSLGEDLEKDLTILVPESWVCHDLEVDAASANLFLHELTIREMEFDGASGTAEFHNCTLDSLDMDTASGDIYFSGSIKTLDIDAASASFYADMITTPSRIDMDSMSGNLELTLPEDTGFTVRLNGVSTDFSSDFETVTRNGAHIYGDGRCKINVEAMSGDVTIHKK